MPVVAEPEETGKTNSMAKLQYIATGFLMMIWVTGLTQAYQPFSRKQFEVTTQKKTQTLLHLPGSPLHFYSDKTSLTAFTVKEINKDSCLILAEPRVLRGKMTGFEQNQEFDSEKPSTIPTTDTAFIRQLLRQPLMIGLSKNHSRLLNTDSVSIVGFLQLGDVQRFMLLLPATSIRKGFNWSDTTQTDSSFNVYQYYISASTADSIQLVVLADLKQETAKEKSTGYYKATRWYQLSTRLLISETAETILNGVSEISNEKHSFTVKITEETRLHQL